jgi:hypothetical protein
MVVGGGGTRRLGEAMERRLGGAECNGKPRRAFIGAGRRFKADILSSRSSNGRQWWFGKNPGVDSGR